MSRNHKRISFFEAHGDKEGTVDSLNTTDELHMIQSTSIIDIKRKLRVYDNIKDEDEFKDILYDNIEDIVKNFNTSDAGSSCSDIQKIGDTYIGLRHMHSKPLKYTKLDAFDVESRFDDLYVEGKDKDLIPLKINFPAKLWCNNKEKRKSLLFTGEGYEPIAKMLPSECSFSSESCAISDSFEVADISVDSLDNDYSINYDEMFSNPTYMGFNKSNDCFVKKQTVNIISENFKNKLILKKTEKRVKKEATEDIEQHIPAGYVTCNQENEILDLDLVEAETDKESLFTNSSTETFEGLLELCDHNENSLFMDLKSNDSDAFNSRNIQTDIVQVPKRSSLRLFNELNFHEHLSHSPLPIPNKNTDIFENFGFPSPLYALRKSENSSQDYTLSYSNRIQKEEAKHGFPFYDTSEDLKEDDDKHGSVSLISIPVLKNGKSSVYGGLGLLSPSKLLNHQESGNEASETKSIVDLLEETCQLARVVIEGI